MKRITLLKEILNVRTEIEILKITDPENGRIKEDVLNQILLNCVMEDSVSILTEIYKSIYGSTDYNIVLLTGNVCYKLSDKSSIIQTVKVISESSSYRIFDAKIKDLKNKKIKPQKIKEEIDEIERNFLCSLYELSLYEQTKIFESISRIKADLYLNGLIDKDKTYEFDDIKEQLLYGVIENIKDDVKESKIDSNDLAWLLKFNYTNENIINLYLEQYKIKISIIEDEGSYDRKKIKYY